jgi:hypothetical protein
VGTLSLLVTSNPFDLGGLLHTHHLECDKDLAKARDARIGAMREMLISIKVIKVRLHQPPLTSIAYMLLAVSAQCVGR